MANGTATGRIASNRPINYSPPGTKPSYEDPANPSWTRAQPGSPQYEYVKHSLAEGRQPYQMGRSPPQQPQRIGIGYKVIRPAPTNLPPHPNYGLGSLPPQQHQGGGYARPPSRQTPNKTVSNPYFSLGGKRPIKFL